MPFSLLIMAGPSTIRTSATMESGICRAAPAAGLLAGGFRVAHAAACGFAAHGAAGVDQEVLHVFLVLAEAAGVADPHGEPLAAFDRRRDRLAAQGHLDHVPDIADVHAVAGGAVAIGPDLQVALALALVGKDVHRPRHAPQGLGHLLGNLLDLVEVVAEDLHADHRPHAGGQHVDAIDDRLRPDVGPAGHADDAVHLLRRDRLSTCVQRYSFGVQALSSSARSLMSFCFSASQSASLGVGRVSFGPIALVLGRFLQLVDGVVVVGGRGAVEDFVVDLLGPLSPLAVALVDDVLPHIGEQRRPLGAEDFGHVEPAVVERAIVRGKQFGVEVDLLAAFRGGQLLDDLLHQPVDVLLAGTGGEDRGELLLKLLGQPVDVGIGHRLRAGGPPSASGRPVPR